MDAKIAIITGTVFAGVLAAGVLAAPLVNTSAGKQDAAASFVQTPADLPSSPSGIVWATTGRNDSDASEEDYDDSDARERDDDDSDDRHEQDDDRRGHDDDRYEDDD